MRAAFDQFAKQLLGATLAPVGTVESECEVAPDPQTIDVWFVPDPGRAKERAALGLLGRMVDRPCLFEAFHQAPDADEVRACLRKHYGWHEVQQKKAGVKATLPLLWILSAGRPRSRMRGFGFAPMAGWPKGVYEAAPDLGLRLVVLSELPAAEDTLPLRLLGAGRVLAEAVAELSRLPAESLLRRQATPIVVRLRIMSAEDLSTRERKALMEASEQMFQDFQRRLLEEGMERGIEQGQQRALQQLFRLRLGRALTDAESRVVAERTLRLGVERIEQVVLASTAGESAAWLAEPDAT